MSDQKRISVGEVEIGEGLPCMLIAEIGLNHNGSMDLAHKLIDASAVSGASFVKFQKRTPEELATAKFLDAPFPKCPLFGRTQREVRNKLELSQEQLRELYAHAKSLGLGFFLSVFDQKSLEVALKLETKLIKVASHSITNEPLLKAIAQTKLPVIASLGASSWQEKDRAVEILRGNPLVLMHCISSYPLADHLAKLDTITEIRKRYQVPVGYSGHEDGTELSVAASVLGACMIERHITLNRSMVGLDHTVSLEPAMFADLVRQIRRIEKARGVVEGIMPEELAARKNYHVAVYARTKLSEGHVIQASDIVCKQPLTDDAKFFRGFDVSLVVGRRLNRTLGAEEAIPRDALS